MATVPGATAVTRTAEPTDALVASPDAHVTGARQRRIRINRRDQLDRLSDLERDARRRTVTLCTTGVGRARAAASAQSPSPCHRRPSGQRSTRSPAKIERDTFCILPPKESDAVNMELQIAASQQTTMCHFQPHGRPAIETTWRLWQRLRSNRAHFALDRRTAEDRLRERGGQDERTRFFRLSQCRLPLAASRVERRPKQSPKSL